MKDLEALPRPVYFVCRNVSRWKDLLADEVDVTLAGLHERFRDARESWSVQPYIQLKERGLNVHLVDKFIPGEICIVTTDELMASDLPYRSYVVCCRHDRGIPYMCEQTIVQNQLNVLSERDHFLPHWPQPFIAARDPSRGTILENIAYKGRLNNLASSFRGDEFRLRLNELGVNLLLSPEEDVARVTDSRDYSNVDMVLAVRDSTEYNLSIKPPSKLINSWISGCPSIMGPEPAYQQLRRHPLDYFEVRSLDEAIEYIRLLKQNPGVFEQAQERCRIRALEFGADAIAQLWRDLLAGEIYQGYQQWAGKSRLESAVLRPIAFAVRYFQHRHEQTQFLKKISEGRRYFG